MEKGRAGSHNSPFKHTPQDSTAKKSLWAVKVPAQVQGGNTCATLAQIRVAPDPRDLQRLRALPVLSAQLEGYPALALALNDHLALVSSPRLHGAPEAGSAQVIYILVAFFALDLALWCFFPATL